MYIYKCPFSIDMLVYQRVSIQCHPNVFRLPIWFAEINLATGEFSCSMPAELPENFLVTPNNNSSLPQLSCSPQAIYGIYKHLSSWNPCATQGPLSNASQTWKQTTHFKAGNIASTLILIDDLAITLKNSSWWYPKTIDVGNPLQIGYTFFIGFTTWLVDRWMISPSYFMISSQSIASLGDVWYHTLHLDVQQPLHRKRSLGKARGQTTSVALPPKPCECDPQSPAPEVAKSPSKIGPVEWIQNAIWLVVLSHLPEKYMKVRLDHHPTTWGK